MFEISTAMPRPFNYIKFRSRVINGGSFLHPETIEIDNNFVTLQKRKNLFSKVRTISIPIPNITNIAVSFNTAGANILIESHAKRKILGKGFSSSSALTIESLLREFAPQCR